MLKVFFYYKVSQERIGVVKRNAAADPAGYCFYGARDLDGKNFEVDHNIKPDQWGGRFKHSLIKHVDHYLHSWGRLWGNMETVLAHRKRANIANVIVATADNVGIPLAFLKLLGLIRPPVIYISVGLPEKISHVLSSVWASLCKVALRKTSCLIAYGFEEALWLKKWLDENPSTGMVRFIPFGVDTEYFRPLSTNHTYDIDVLSIGADLQRDYTLLMLFAAAHPKTKILVVTNEETAQTLVSVPANVTIVCNVPFSEIRSFFERARVVALPVKENTYSGATTTLLQAMAMAKPVVISQVGAIREGYGLRNNENCLCVTPGDVEGFQSALERLLGDSSLADRIGQNARRHVVSTLSWGKYVDNIKTVLQEAVGKSHCKK